MGGSGSTPRGASRSLVQSALDAATHVLRPEVRGQTAWGEALRALPPTASVIAFESDDGAALLIGVTADARAFATKRLAGGGEETTKGGRADLGEVVARVSVIPVGSGFEADLVYFALVRERMPRVYRQLMARWALSVVGLDATEGIPEPVALGLEEAGPRPPEWLLGPVEAKGAGRLIDAVVDAFDLCRYPNILRHAPRGVACAYKEMGRCPAPCDGSETLEAFRARVAAAVSSVGLSATQREAGVRAAMKEAAASARFEEAAALKRSLERLGALNQVAGRVGTFATFRHVVVTAVGAGDKSPLLSWWAGGRCAGVCGPSDATVNLSELARTPVRTPLTPDEVEAVMVIHRWMQEKPGRRRVRVVPVTDENDAAAVGTAVRSVVARRGGEEEVAMDEVEHRDDI
jgi:hypothetical protein